MECIVDKEQCRQRQVTNVVVATEQDSNTKYEIEKRMWVNATVRTEKGTSNEKRDNPTSEVGRGGGCMQ